MSTAGCRGVLIADGAPWLSARLAIAVLCTTIPACAPSSAEPAANPSQARADGSSSRDAAGAPLPAADPFWDGFERQSIQLDQTLLVVKGSRGIAGCTYLNVDTFERGGEACAIIPAADFDGMLDAKVTAATSEAKALGIQVGMPGREALELLR